jgi:O-antigen ligase/tetratricopeptide (TPR) repeat protein
MRPSFQSNTSSGGRPKNTSLQSPIGMLDALADLAILAIIFITPLFMGGRHDLGRLVYVGAVGVLVVAWTWRQWLAGETVWWKVRGGWLLLGGLGVLFLQLVTLGPGILAALSPAQEGLLPLWHSSDDAPALLSRWSQISLTPRGTKIGLVVYWAHICLFFVVVQRLTSLEKIERLLRWVALGALSMALFGFAQYISGTEDYAWVFQHPSRRAHWYVCGPFANSNHFAHFLALGIGPLVWWIQSLGVNSAAGPTGNRFYNSSHRERDLFARMMVVFACGVLGISGLLSLSRGGMLAMAIAGLLAVGLFAMTGLVGRKAFYAMGAVFLLAGAGLYLHGADVVTKEIGSLASGSMEELDETHGRRRIWAANAQIAKAFPILGAGVGSHSEIYHKFFPHRSRVEFTHAESSYLNLLSETGIVGLALALAGVVLCLRWCWQVLRYAKNVRAGACGIAVTASVVASVTHSIWDFVWYIGGCMSLTILIVACACRLAGEHTRGKKSKVGSQKVGSALWLAGGFAAAAMFVALISVQWGPAFAASHWNKYLRLSLANRSTLNQVYADKGAIVSAKTDDQRYESLRQMYTCLDEVLRHDPTHYRAQLRACSVLVKSFDLLQKQSVNAMGYVQIRDAVWASEFATIEDQDRWLDRAIGTNIDILRSALDHALTGLRGCPLQGRGYIHWADIAFLRGSRPELTMTLLAQAERVRPYDGAVLFGLGREAAFAGQPMDALEYWKRAFHLDAQYRNAVMQALASRMTAIHFVQQFNPNPEETEALFHFYRVRNAQADARALAPVLGSYLSQVAQTKTGDEAMRIWLKCVGIYRSVEDGPAAVKAAESAVAANPNSFEVRVTLAHQLSKEQRFREAEEQWLWCARRHPQDQAVLKQLQRIRTLQQSTASRPDFASGTTVMH